VFVVSTHKYQPNLSVVVVIDDGEFVVKVFEVASFVAVGEVVLVVEVLVGEESSTVVAVCVGVVLVGMVLVGLVVVVVVVIAVVDTSFVVVVGFPVVVVPGLVFGGLVV